MGVWLRLFAVNLVTDVVTKRFSTVPDAALDQVKQVKAIAIWPNAAEAEDTLLVTIATLKCGAISMREGNLPLKTVGDG